MIKTTQPKTTNKIKLPRKRQSLLPIFNTSVITPRLVLRRIDMRDALILAKAMRNANGAMKSFFKFPKDSDDADFVSDVIIPTMRNFEREIGYFYLGAFRIGAPDKMVGMVLCKQDSDNIVRVSYFVAPSQRRRHYAREIYEHMTRVIAKGTGQTQMVAQVATGNAASLHLLHAMGFKALGLRSSTMQRGHQGKYITLRKTI